MASHFERSAQALFSGLRFKEDDLLCDIVIDVNACQKIGPIITTARKLFIHDQIVKGLGHILCGFFSDSLMKQLRTSLAKGSLLDYPNF